MSNLSKKNRLTIFGCAEKKQEIILNEISKIEGLFTTDMLGWLASLFDPNTGGFYYSNSARDNDGFLPDIESTNQVIAILARSGAISSYEDLPRLIKREIAFFVSQKEDSETGLFFHPQWKYETTEHHVPRLSRDLSAATVLSSCLSFNLATPTSGAKKVVNEIENKNNQLFGHLSSKESLIAYLENMPINHETASLISSQNSILKSSGLYDDVCDWFVSKQNTETGLFEDENKRTSISTFSAVSSLFIDGGRYLPYAERAIPHILRHLSSDNIGGVYYVSACWRSLANIISNSKNNKAIMENLMKEIAEGADGALEKTFYIMSNSRRNDGSFSYRLNESSSLSQGMPVAVPHTCEGDVNATLLAVGTLIAIYETLGIRAAKGTLFTSSDFANFLENIKLY